MIFSLDPHSRIDSPVHRLPAWANQAAARELGKAELSDRAGVMQPLPPKVSTIVDTELQARWSPTSRFN